MIQRAVRRDDRVDCIGCCVHDTVQCASRVVAAQCARHRADHTVQRTGRIVRATQRTRDRTHHTVQCARRIVTAQRTRHRAHHTIQCTGRIVRTAKRTRDRTDHAIQRARRIVTAQRTRHRAHHTVQCTGRIVRTAQRTRHRTNHAIQRTRRIASAERARRRPDRAAQRPARRIERTRQRASRIVRTTQCARDGTDGTAHCTAHRATNRTARIAAAERADHLPDCALHLPERIDRAAASAAEHTGHRMRDTVQHAARIADRRADRARPGCGHVNRAQRRRARRREARRYALRRRIDDHLRNRESIERTGRGNRRPRSQHPERGRYGQRPTRQFKVISHRDLISVGTSLIKHGDRLHEVCHREIHAEFHDLLRCNNREKPDSIKK
ncbi:hypothetical protein FEP43_03597 [Burkholderia multivorans]|nr:hypothetical protein [Burkholderia multivorans]